MSTRSPWVAPLSRAPALEDEQWRESNAAMYSREPMGSETGRPLAVALDAGPATLPKVGGKGISLARMSRAGVPVPAGFLVTTDAYRAFVESNALQASPIWTPLLGIAAAAVTEVGGPFAHAAIVAREFGIPLVDGATDATRVIVDGSKVVVDGTAGIVEL
jgi:phosphoenolpyruvate synthase/pyruvate phosphate dikinase